mmetsp:Transcript_11586/g.21509  ORF Transcript_11586/g.21509 Transcript_11586/m.21509 type:complete len:815 (-) Transcript_11586:69-2513(-)|eukprot:CAMPEP_0184553238 /NCGR_PEP_ID=MMETSP0199_2-20130426/31340_1 /TAXON_ID=1112570 /ORGANISM="Thraustochytrium sp., Strain LLF1b" /LENGTH=814 /DNA_ID=CAMNT_0026948931 /DNA_START=334 /DNA_END=2778 /DNA_ORIENTATION=+
MEGEDYEAELAKLPTNLYDDDDEGHGNDEDNQGEPSRPTSAPPMLDNQNLFSFPVNAFQPAEDTFASIGEDTFPNIMPSPLGVMTPDGVFATDDSAFKMKQTDPRKRTQSIDKFLAQSPGSILGPRKKYVNNASGVPRNSAGGVGGVPPPAGFSHLAHAHNGNSANSRNGANESSEGPVGTGQGSANDSLQYILAESPGIGLRGLHKRLDALDLSTPAIDEGSPQYYYGDQVRQGPQGGKQSPVRSPGHATGQESDGTDGLQQQKQAQTVSNHQQQPDGHQDHQQQFYSDSTMAYDATNGAYLPQSMYMQQQYSAMPGGHHFMAESERMPYFQGTNGVPPPPPFPPSSPQGVYQNNSAQQFVPVGEPMMNGMQKVMFPNGVEAMVVPMMANQTTGGTSSGASGGNMGWQNGVPPPPPTAAVSQPSQYYHPHGQNIEQTQGQGGKRGGRGQTNGRPRNEKMSQQSENVGLLSSSAPLEGFRGMIFRLSQEQNGCRFLQQRVDREGSKAVELILSEVRSNLVTLMMDPFGNYLFQKLLEHANREQRDIMLQETRDYLVEAALNLHGTRSVQKFIQVCGGELDLAQLDEVTTKLWPHITKMSMDQNGNHVVQRCLQHVPHDRAKIIYDSVVRDVLVITRHRHGCCVFQRCIDAADPEQRNALIDEIVRHGVDLMQDPFGNYVVQYVLEHSRHQEASRIIGQLPTRMALLSTQKFSSNVVEKCLQHASQAELEPLIDELCDSDVMRKFLNDQFANYVVQRALQVANDKYGMRLVQAIRPHMTNLASSNASCARRVSSRVIKRFPALSSDKLFSAFAQK